MQSDCLFCKIASDPDKLIWEDEHNAAFKDIHPKARVHILVVPKTHYATLDETPPEAAGGLIGAIQEVAKQEGVSGSYKVQINVGRSAGQEVDHVHAHILAS